MSSRNDCIRLSFFKVLLHEAEMCSGTGRIYEEENRFFQRHYLELDSLFNEQFIQKKTSGHKVVSFYSRFECSTLEALFTHSKSHYLLGASWLDNSLAWDL